MLRDPWLRALAILGCAIAGFYLVGLLWQVVQNLADIILLFFLAWLIAFVLEPLVGTLETRVPRLLSIFITYATLLVLLSLAVLLLVPALTAQTVEVVRSLPSYMEQITQLLTDLQGTANAWLIDHHSPILIDLQAALDPQELSRRADAVGPQVLGNVVGFATGAATLLLEVLALIVLSFYFMADG
ncbi:MAG TPA: AI-2E family transporter, partial [Chloroflexota bacterium]|nr:AI-2E family transporter [Chloroflexota bacterium]